jgi:hypothetical protein
MITKQSLIAGIRPDSEEQPADKSRRALIGGALGARITHLNSSLA